MNIFKILVAIFFSIPLWGDLVDYASLKYHGGQGVGYHRGYGTLSFFAVPFQVDSMNFFFDGRGHLFDNGRFAGNIGVGARYQVDCLILGANLYYDVRHSHYNYHQVGLGVELLNPWADVRVNGYLPTNKKSHVVKRAFFNNFIGNFFEICKLHEFSYGGLDGEIGRCLYSSCCEYYVSIYAAIGSYYLHSKRSCHKNIWGAQARAKVDLTQFVSLEVMATTDPVFHERVQGVISLSFPFGSCSYSCTEAPGCLPPVRREIIVLDKRCHFKNNFSQ